MTALEKARKLAASAGRSQALKLAPLAMAMVMSAHAGSLGVESVACLDSSFSGGNVAGNLSSSPLPMQVNGVQGFKGFGKCGVFGEPYSGMGATAFWYGTGQGFNGGPSVNVPIDYEFTFLGNAEFSYIDWELNFFADETLVGSESGSDSMYTPISGTFTIPLPGEFESFSMALQFIGYYGDSFRVSSDEPVIGLLGDEIDFDSAALYVDIPQNSIDVNRATDQGQVPEPGMFVLAGTGLLGLAFWRKVRG